MDEIGSAENQNKYAPLLMRLKSGGTQAAKNLKSLKL
jgi:hypothetical protein